MSQSTAQSRHRHRSALDGWAALDWRLAAAACRSALEEIQPFDPEADTTIFVGFGCTAARTTPYRVGRWLRLSAGRCSTARRCTRCGCGSLNERDCLHALSRCRRCNDQRGTGARRLCDAMAGAGARVKQPDAMPWRCCECRWCMRSLQRLMGALWLSAPAIRAQLARLRLSTNTVVISPRARHDDHHVRRISQLAEAASKWSYSWASCSPHPLW